MSALRLYSYWRSSASWRVRLALAYKGLAYDYVPVHLLKDGGEQRAPAFLAKNPFATVPMLEVETAAGPVFFSQSLAIIAYLDARFGAPLLVPEDAVLRARVLELAELVNSGIHPLQNLSTIAYVRDILGQDERAFAQHFITRGLAALEQRLDAGAALGTTPSAAGLPRYALADTFSLADACIVPQLFNARRFGIDLSPYPRLCAVEAAVLALPALQKAHPNVQPDATP